MSVFAIARQAGLVLALAGLASPLLAATDPDMQIVSGRSVTRTAVVKFGDLDLDRRGDRARLGRRIVVAADKVCAVPDESIVNSTSDFQLCHDRAVASARAALPAAVRTAAAGGSAAILLR